MKLRRICGLVREKAGVSVPALNEIEIASRFFSPNTLAWIGSIALGAICVAIGLGRFVPGVPYIKVVAAMSVVTMLAVAAAFAIRWPQFDRGIVIVANAPARIRPPAPPPIRSRSKPANRSVSCGVTDGFSLPVHLTAKRVG